MLVLLIIFMVTAPMMQRGLDVNLPQSRRAQQINDQQRVFVTVPLTFRKDHTRARSARSRCRSTCSPSACGRRCGGSRQKQVFLAVRRRR